MLSYTRFFPIRLVNKQSNFVVPICRKIFSQAFMLEDVWKQRLQSPILTKIKVNDLFYELDNQFQHFAYASALDIDLFVNAVDDDSNFDEVDDVVHKLRLSPEAINILPSTQHALIRLYLSFNKTDDLMRILDDRLNYGIHPDEYTSLLLMDCFIKQGNFRDAAKISTLNMLQEDCSHPLIKYMSLYSCHKYLENPTPWTTQEDNVPEVEDDEEEEVVKVRVNYSRKPYFDDNFDLVNPRHLIGKTLHFIGTDIEDEIGRTYKLLGLILHDKFHQATDYIKLITKNESRVVFQDGLNLAKNELDEKLKVDGKDGNYESVVNELKELINSSFSSSQLVSDGLLLNFVEDRLKKFVEKYESSEINKQLQLYKHWEESRQNLLMEQIAKIKKEKQLAEIQRKKQEILEKEDELFFFDNEDKLDLIIEEKDRKKKEQDEREAARLEAKKRLPPIGKQRIRKIGIKDIKHPLESFYDENIPKKNINTKIM